MMTLQFADTHNLVTFLAKPAESEGFEQVVDFLNASSIRYALTVNPTIYTLCIEQFWATIKVKTVNEEQQLQALVDGKKIVVTEASVRRDLQLDDEEGTNFLPNATIFEELTRIGMVKNLDNAGKFLMYPRFIQVFLNNQLEGMSSHKRIYVTPSHTNKIFANIRRQGKDFSKRETPLFPTMVVQAQEEMGEGSEVPTDPHHTPIITKPSSSQPQRKRKSRRPKEKDTQVPQSSVPSDPTNIADEDVHEEPTQEITSLKKRVKKLKKKGGSRTHKLKRLYMVGRSTRVVSSEEASLGDQEDASKLRRKIDDINKDAEITLVDETEGRYRDEDMFRVNDLYGDEVKDQGYCSKDKGKAKMIELDKPLKKKDQIKFDEEEALRLQAKFDEEDRLAREKAQQVKEANIAWDDIQNMAGWKPKDLKNKSFANIQELFDKDMKRVNTFVDMDTNLVEGSEQKVDDDQEAAKIKEFIKIIPDEEEVAVDAIPLATKPASIVDWKIVKEGKISYYQIIRADRSSRRYSAFIQMLRSFDKEDLETLWKLVKAKYGYTRPKEGYKRMLWGDLKTMFEHHVEDAVWRNLRESM
ncbi:hypothetical protein Tco_0546086 [Tanacetum coccineum]